MGAYSPAPVMTPEMTKRTMDEIILPTVRAMKAMGAPYKGVLFAGLMITKDGPKLIEYNARFGDPECQVLMLRLEDDLGELLLACAENRLATLPAPRLSNDIALTVVLAAEGYPDAPQKGGAIAGIAAAEASGALVFHAGTALRDGELVASGGRVLNITTSGASVSEARERAYFAISAIDFAEGFCRSDIGWREIERETQNDD
jgi:phosphoribosylamine--glycine ligase